jgi:biotin transport system substrate-specific component
METAIKHKTLYDVLFKQKNIFLDIFLILFSVAFLAGMANLRIPLWPVPITMQTFGVFVIAFFFGSRKGFLSVLAYVLAGIVGFGVFAGFKSGMAAIIGPTGGYIVGFLFAAFFVGLMIEKGYGRDWKSVLLCIVIGNLIIYCFGLIGLRLYFADFTWLKILSVGLIPFLIGDALKIIGAVALFPYLWKGSEKLAS